MRQAGGLVISALLLSMVVFGCGKSQVDQALDSDANGYSCAKCQTKFYTDRDVFATRCPECKSPAPQMLLGFLCAADQQVVLATARRSVSACTKCGKPVSSQCIPREVDFKAQGATKRSAAEVGG